MDFKDGSIEVSIITPMYNAEQYIVDTIRSVQEQTFKNWEMLLIDDASTDQTINKISEFIEKDSRIKLIRQLENGGAGKARNKGLEKANGRYIAFLDSDDTWSPRKLELQLGFMTENNLAFSYTSYERVHIHDSGTKIVPVIAPETLSYSSLLKNCVIGCLTVMIDTSVTGIVRMQDIRSRQDYALWLELVRNGHIPKGLNQVLAQYRVRNNSISSNKLKMAKQNWFVFRKIEKLPIYKSLWYFINYAILKTKAYRSYK